MLLTRPKELISETARKLRTLGAEVLEMPAIRTVKIDNNEPLYQALHCIGQYNWLVFTSPTGVRVFFEELASQKLDMRNLGTIKIAAIGGGTKKELEKRGLYADLVPEIFDGEHLGVALEAAAGEGDKILIPRASMGSSELTKPLLASPKQFRVDDIPTYDTQYETGRLSHEKEEFERGEIDYALFTSASTVRGFAAAMGKMDFTKIKAVCIGKQTKAAADALGMQTWMSEKASIDSLVNKLADIHRSVSKSS